MKCEQSEKEIREWEEISLRLAAALEMLAVYPVPYPTECLPVLIF